MTEYQALIYKTNRNKTFIANCITNNLSGYGKTEQEAIKNLNKSLQRATGKIDIQIKSSYKLPLINNF